MDFLILFEGVEYILTEGGAIAKQADYENGICSFAHLCDDGLIRRFNKVIGSKKDITVIGAYDAPEPTIESFDNLGTHPSWTPPERN